MATPEQYLSRGEGGGHPTETLDPRHLYAAFVFDEAHLRRRDVANLIAHVQRCGYPLRYWWLPEVRESPGSSNCLMVCVHYPSTVEAGGLDLHEALKENLTEHRVTWDDLIPVAVDAYRQFGKPIETPGSIHWPGGTPLFPPPTERAAATDNRQATHYCWCGEPALWISRYGNIACSAHASDLSDPILIPDFAYVDRDAEPIFTLNRKDIQIVARTKLGRALTADELKVVEAVLPDELDWRGSIEAAIESCLGWGYVGSAAAGHEQAAGEAPAEFP